MSEIQDPAELRRRWLAARTKEQEALALADKFRARIVEVKEHARREVASVLTTLAERPTREAYERARRERAAALAAHDDAEREVARLKRSNAALRGALTRQAKRAEALLAQIRNGAQKKHSARSRKRTGG